MLWIGAGVGMVLIGYLVFMKLRQRRHMKMIEDLMATHIEASLELLKTKSGFIRSVPPELVTNCTCSDKNEEWNFDVSLGCWYVERECQQCEYYWEGPYYLYDDPNIRGNTLE
ncbi:hypothetical protein OM416_20175 [Paenibacillus sp. LS1]|uniref:hypothetical protein n=1 Tax=Paenibacillus sp. LS1 TaxID=2992120 RepID=UPI00223023C9|nr:hypothetical protein [Paenibacillus sp. LS1]MCW3793914.1 hypothetical protein [Paenibacillus sp. LS1]